MHTDSADPVRSQLQGAFSLDLSVRGFGARRRGKYAQVRIVDQV